MTPGNWEFQLETAGMDPRTITRCIKADEAASVNGDTAAGRAWAEKQAGKGCVVKEYGVDGNTVTFRIECEGATITSKTTYKGDSSDGVLITKHEGKEITTHVKARRTGDCP